MVITNIEYANKIVDANSNLMWDGWTIVEFKPSPTAEFKPNGKRINGVWGFVQEFIPTQSGWEVPNKYAR